MTWCVIYIAIAAATSKLPPTECGYTIHDICTGKALAVNSHMYNPDIEKIPYMAMCVEANDVGKYLQAMYIEKIIEARDAHL